MHANDVVPDLTCFSLDLHVFFHILLCFISVNTNKGKPTFKFQMQVWLRNHIDLRSPSFHSSVSLDSPLNAVKNFTVSQVAKFSPLRFLESSSPKHTLMSVMMLSSIVMPVCEDCSLAILIRTHQATL